MSAVDLPGGVTQDAAFDFFEKNLTAELLHIFNECGVPVGLQYKLGQHFKNVKKFSTYADTRSDVRAALKADHSLEATNQDTRAAVASVVSAWESCREFSSLPQNTEDLRTVLRVEGNAWVFLASKYKNKVAGASRRLRSDKIR